MNKPLLIFAHRREAISFFEQHQYSNIDFVFSDCFECETHFLMITGEGVQEASEKTSAFLGAHYKSISAVYNLGVCGSLNSKKYQTNDIIEIETIYAEDNFKSFSACLSRHDCIKASLISAKQRVLNTEYAQHLLVIADLADREAWGIASAVQKFKRPFYCIKIVSDLSQGNEICQVVKELAPLFSEKLYQYLARTNFFSQTTQKVQASSQKAELPNVEMFYFTTTQTRQLESLIKDLLIKHQTIHHILLLIKYDEIKTMDLLPKARTTELLKRLSHLLNPMLSQIEAQLKHETDVLEKGHFKVHFSQHFENDLITLSGKIEHPKNIEQMREALKEFNYQKVIDILHGKFHV